jgi:RND family efflux transporter MFP subunit
MSDRIILSLATIPMVAGVLLLGVLQRGEARVSQEPKARGAQLGAQAPLPAADTAWLGVVVAGQAAELASEFGGRVTRVFHEAGVPVKQGDPILQIDRDDAAAAIGVAGAEVAQKEADVARADARLEAARSKLARVSEGGQWLSAQELDSARAEVRVAEAELRAARSLVSMGRARVAQQRVRDKKLTISAPFDGRLVAVEVDAGDNVTPGRVLARVISEDRRIKFALPRDAVNTQLGEVLVARPGMESALRARVASVRPEVDPAAQMVFAVAALPDVPETRSWLPGTDVRVFAAPTESSPGAER